MEKLTMDQECVKLLSEYLKIDTSNPPGNEENAARFFAEIFDREGIEYKTYEPLPGRTSIRACLHGSGQKGPVILLNHMDVVVANADEWSFDPFGGEVRDGFIQGRGALDMKGQGIMELMAFLKMKREGKMPIRDLVFLAVADEETGGSVGVGKLLEMHPEDFKADLVLNEGGFGVTGLLPNGPAMMVSTAEKGLCWLRLTRSGPPGHGSSPHGENALERMNLALSKLLADPAPVEIKPVVAEYFRQLGQGWGFLAPFLEDGKAETLVEILTASGLIAMPQIGAMVRNTVSLNLMHAGEKTNVIPSRVTAELDARLLPGQDPEEFIESIRKKLDDDSIEIEGIAVGTATESTTDSESYEVITQVLKEHFPDAVIAPSLLFGTSDSGHFRKSGVPSYGVCPILVQMDDIKMVHGIDEKISVDNLVMGSRVYCDLVERLCI